MTNKRPPKIVHSEQTDCMRARKLLADVAMERPRAVSIMYIKDDGIHYVCTGLSRLERMGALAYAQCEEWDV